VKAEAWHARAAIALREGDAELALESARRAVALDRNNPLYLNRLGIAHGELGDLRAAEQAFRRALKARPAYAAGHHNLAKALQKQGRLSESLKEFERAHKLEPQSTEMQLSLCGIYRLGGQPERALAVLRAAASEGPPAPSHVPQFADCIADVEGAHAALAWLRSVVAQQPDSQPAHYALAVMLLSVGEWREGWQHYLWRPRQGERPAALPRQGKIILRGEYGLGDVLFFLRFASGPFALQLPPPLAKLAPILAGRATAYGALALLLLLLFWWSPTPGFERLPTSILIILLFIVGLEALRHQAIRDFPGETWERGVERWRGALRSLFRRGPARSG
jgi:tetratricopeptide (TPR) repeat protein